jgi:hypothetical protein
MYKRLGPLVTKIALGVFEVGGVALKVPPAVHK